MSSLTVIVPVYNGGRTLEKCLASIRCSSGVSFDLVVIDDGSTDGSREIARQYADRVLLLEKNGGRQRTRNAGLDVARGDVIVSIDADIVIPPDALFKIDVFLKEHEDVVALSGMLSSEAPLKGFFSEYKNLYMHYIFDQLPENVSFLYGSIFALRARIKHLCYFDREIAEDTSLGYMLADRGHKVFLFKELEVVHMKEYTPWSFMANDFRIPFHWARKFWRSGGWKKALKKGPVFAHASKTQVLSLFLTVFTVVFITKPAGLFCFALWLLFNVRFIVFLSHRRGVVFGIKAFLLTFVDHLVMFSGVIVGTVVLLKPRTLK